MSADALVEDFFADVEQAQCSTAAAMSAYVQRRTSQLFAALMRDYPRYRIDWERFNGRLAAARNEHAVYMAWLSGAAAANAPLRRSGSPWSPSPPLECP